MAYRKRARTSRRAEACDCPTVNWAKAGEQVGSGLGALAKKGWSYLTGGGDYTLHSNSLLLGGGSTAGQQVAQIMPSGPREVRIRYKEYLGDVFTHPTTPGNFLVTGYPINPGQLLTFPWLAGLASSFEQWSPNGIVFEFRSTSSEYVATQALGSVIMATEYDTLDTVFGNKQEMLNSAYSNEAKPSQQILHGVECARQDSPTHIYYVRTGGVPAGGNIRDYDMGTFYVATQGGAAANLNLGSLYVHYDITFRKETMRANPALLLSSRWKLSNSTTLTMGNLFNSTLAIPISEVSNGLGITLGESAGGGTPNTINFPPTINSGYFVICWELRGTGLGPVTNPTTTLFNCVTDDWRPTNPDGPLLFVNSSLTADRTVLCLRIRVTGPSARVTLGNNAVVAGTLTSHSLYVMSVSNWGL